MKNKLMVDGYYPISQVPSYLLKSGGTMSGDLDLGGNNLTNFVTDHFDGYSLIGGAALTEVFEFFPDMPDGYSIVTIGIRIVAWEVVNKTVSGVAEATLSVRSNGTSLTILGTPVWDRVSQGFPSTFDCEVSVDLINTDALSIKVKPGANNARCNVYCWMQSPVLLLG
jgi:hypothetical protein